MDLDYLLRVVEVAAEYGYNALQICGDTHDQGNLDGITEFVRFPRANELRDMEAVRRRREILRTVCRAAHDRGMEVYYWHHELWFPERLWEVYPEWFVPAPQNRFRRDLRVDLVPRVGPEAPFWRFMDAKFDEAFQQCPELDGTVMTIQESRVPVYCLSEDFEWQVEALVDLYRRLERAHERAGKNRGAGTCWSYSPAQRCASAGPCRSAVANGSTASTSASTPGSSPTIASGATR